MTWAGIITALCLLSLAIAIIYLTFENWKIHRPSTRVFCWVYAGYLIFEAFTTLYEPDTVTNIIQSVIVVAILCPIVICIARLMRLGDFFQIASMIRGLRSQLKELEYMAPTSVKLRQMNMRIEAMLDTLDELIDKKK